MSCFQIILLLTTMILDTPPPHSYPIFPSPDPALQFQGIRCSVWPLTLPKRKEKSRHEEDVSISWMTGWREGEERSRGNTVPALRAEAVDLRAFQTSLGHTVGPGHLGLHKESLPESVQRLWAGCFASSHSLPFLTSTVMATSPERSTAPARLRESAKIQVGTREKSREGAGEELQGECIWRVGRAHLGPFWSHALPHNQASQV